MTLEAIGHGLGWASAVGCVLAFGFMAVGVWLMGLHLALRRRGLAAERAGLAVPLPPEGGLPHIVVQIPSFNEGAMVARAAAAAGALDWPRDRLHIQMLDDSTDDTTEHAAAAAAALRAAGCDAELLHRTDRTDFKAGALAAGMARAPHPFYAILDVDYLPAPDFLRRCMAPLLAAPRAAFVQARCDYLNAHENRITQVQMLMLDSHFAIEQATRSWAGHPVPFNGTCGIWRRAAIEAAGGWRGDCLAEDLDLSYRAWLKGWRGMFLATVAVPGELPATVRAWSRQQRRWTKGFGQVVRRMLPVILRDRGIGMRGKLASLAHLAMWWSLPISNAAFWGGVVALVLAPALLSSLGLVLLALAVLGHVTMFAYLRAGNLFFAEHALPWPRFARLYLRVMGIGNYVLVANLRAYVEALSGRQTIFERTPKRGGLPRA